MINRILASLTMACAVMGVTASGQTVSWNGHEYRVIQYKDATGKDYIPEVQGWLLNNPNGGNEETEAHAASLGGHIATITSAQEEQAIRGLWALIPGTRRTILPTLGVDLEASPPLVHWRTGEVSDYLGQIFSLDLRVLTLIDDPQDPGQMKLYVTDGQSYRDGAAFYILEKDPIIGGADADGDGIPDRQEKNTRHHYEFIQVPDPWSLQNEFGGWSFGRCNADAIQRGGHIIDVGNPAELLYLNQLADWPVADGSAGPRTPYTNGDGTGVLKTGSHPHEIYTTTLFSTERFSTYILEIEDSTDPNKADTDGDGFDDKSELDSGSDPIDPMSVPEVVNIVAYPALEIEFGTVAGHKYQTQVSTDLKVWTNLGEPVVAAGSALSRFIQAREQASFVRVVLAK